MLLGGSGKMAVAHDARGHRDRAEHPGRSAAHHPATTCAPSWQAVTALEFSIESHETEPQLLQILAPNEAVVAISLEVRIGETAGMMNIGIPSIIVKMLRQKFDQQWSVRKTKATEEEHARVLRLIRPALIHLDARLQGPTLSVQALLDLQEGDIVLFDYPIERPVDLAVNGRLKYEGEMVTTGRKRAFQIREKVTEA